MDVSQSKTTTVAEMTALAASFAATLRPGMRVGLNGPLGAGKTTFVKSVAVALGVLEDVLSPTYLYHQSYAAQLLDGTKAVLHHLDFYRLRDERDVAALDLPIDDPDGIVLIEWSDRTPTIEAALDVVITIAIKGEDRLVCIARRGQP